MVEQRTAAQLLGAENGGTEVIVRDRDGAIFIRQDVAERVIDRLRAQLAELQRPAHDASETLAANEICGFLRNRGMLLTVQSAFDLARAVLAAVAGRIRAAERERILQLMGAKERSIATAVPATVIVNGRISHHRARAASIVAITIDLLRAAIRAGAGDGE